MTQSIVAAVAAEADDTLLANSTITATHGQSLYVCVCVREMKLVYVHGSLSLLQLHTGSHYVCMCM